MPLLFTTPLLKKKNNNKIIIIIYYSPPRYIIIGSSCDDDYVIELNNIKVSTVLVLHSISSTTLNSKMAEQ